MWDPAWILFPSFFLVAAVIIVVRGPRIKAKHRVGCMCSIAGSVAVLAVFFSLLDFLV